jgi:hypothetical protein
MLLGLDGGLIRIIPWNPNDRLGSLSPFLDPSRLVFLNRRMLLLISDHLFWW